MIAEILADTPNIRLTLRDFFEWDNSERLALCLVLLAISGALLLIFRRKR